MSYFTLDGLGAPAAPARRYLKLSRGHAGVVRRPVRRRQGLAGLGQTSECGPQPEIAAGEQARCCPGVGWVIYDSSESEIGLCDRARQQAGGGGASEPSSDLPGLTEDPFGRVEALREKLETEREQLEEEQFEQQKRELQLRMLLGQMKAVRKAEAKRIEREQERERAREAAKAKIAREKRQAEQRKKWLIGSAIALGAAKVLGVF